MMKDYITVNRQPCPVKYLSNHFGPFSKGSPNSKCCQAFLILLCFEFLVYMV